MFRFIYDLLRDLRLLTKQPYSSHKKRQVVRTYLRLGLRSLFLGAGEYGVAPVREKICGFTVSGFNRRTLWFLFREIFIKGEYAFKATGDSPRIFDCGANIGMATVFFKWLYPKSSITVFEPAPQIFAMLERTIRDNGFKDVTAHNIALGGSEGTTTLYSDPKNPGSLLTSTVKERREGAAQTVPLSTVSSFLSMPIDFLKVDTEGAETDIIHELCESKTIHHVREMAIEYHHKIGKQTSSLSMILRDIEAAGFEYQIDSTFAPVTRRNRFQDIIIYCYR